MAVCFDVGSQPYQSVSRSVSRCNTMDCGENAVIRRKNGDCIYTKFCTVEIRNLTIKSARLYRHG